MRQLALRPHEETAHVQEHCVSGSAGCAFGGHVIVKLKHRKETLPVSQPFARLFQQM
jgi:hypothetical protein